MEQVIMFSYSHGANVSKLVRSLTNQEMFVFSTNRPIRCRVSLISRKKHVSKGQKDGFIISCETPVSWHNSDLINEPNRGSKQQSEHTAVIPITQKYVLLLSTVDLHKDYTAITLGIFDTFIEGHYGNHTAGNSLCLLHVAVSL